MKKLLLATLLIAIFCGNAFSLQFGLEFTATEQPVIGANLRINDVFEFKPQLGFYFSDPANLLQLIFHGNYYFSDISGLQQYAGGALNMIVGEGDSNFMINGHYGMRYDINDVLSLFGEAGFDMDFDPFVFSSVTGAAGITFFIP